MRFSYWLRNWKRSISAACRRTQTSSRQRASFRPRLEALEDRWLPSNYTAGSVSDLIADINAANKAGGTNTISLTANTTFDLTAVNNSTNGANGLPVISGGGKEVAADDLTILGNGDIIQRDTAAPALRLFDVASAGSLTLEDMTLQGGLAYGSGAAADGGAIYNQGTLNFLNTIVQGNTAAGSNGANGAVVNQKKATGAINGQPGANAEGGGVWSSGSVKLLGDTLLQNNQAIGGQGGNPGRNGNTLGHGGDGGGGYGGGLYEAGGSVSATGMVNANNATFNGNVARGGVGGLGPPYYAGYITGGSYASGVGGVGSGGGLYMANGTLKLSALLVEHNLAEGGAGGNSSYYGIAAPGGVGSGGGIAIANAQSATLSSVHLMSNTVAGGTGGYSNGGGGNGGNAYGGGLYVGGGAVTLTNDTVTGNKAIGGSGGLGNFPTTPHDGAAGGAGINIASGAKVSLDSFTLQNTTSNYDYWDGYIKEDNIDGSYTLA